MIISLMIERNDEDRNEEEEAEEDLHFGVDDKHITNKQEEDDNDAVGKKRPATTTIMEKTKKYGRKERTPLLRREKFRLLFNRIIKNDIRREYGMMFINVMNGGKGDWIRKFVNQFCICKVKAEDGLWEVLGRDKMEVEGLKEVCKLFVGYFDKTPDAVLLLQRCKIVRKYGEMGSRIEMDVNLCANIVMIVSRNKDDNHSGNSKYNNNHNNNNHNIYNHNTEKRKIMMITNDLNMNMVNDTNDTNDKINENKSMVNTDMISNTSSVEYDIQTIPLDLNVLISLELNVQHRIEKINIYVQ
jgi:adenylate kinase family enzyme